MPEEIIEVEDLHRSFGNIKAVSGVSFSVERGKVVGFIGANGAGKTTTMRMMATLDLPTMGTIRVCGFDAGDNPAEVRRRVGWMPDSYGTYENMTIVEYLDFFGRSYGYGHSDRRKRVESVMEFSGLGPIADRSIDKLSKGMGQRLCLGRTLIHDPEVLVMDEPAAGLDPKARIEFKNLVRLLAGEGKTIFISSHILSELGEMCDHLLFLDAGRIVHEGSMESLTQHKDGACFVEIRVAGESAELLAFLDRHPAVEVSERLRNGARIGIAVGDGQQELLRELILAGIPITDFARIERRLEDAFVDMLRAAPPPLP